MEQNHHNFGQDLLHDISFPPSFMEGCPMFIAHDENGNENVQDLGKRPIPFQYDQDQLMANSSQETIESLFGRYLPKRRRLNTKILNLMDLEDDLLEVIFLELIDGERPKVVRPRQLKDLLRAFSFAFTNIRTTEVFRTYTSNKVHTIDAIFPHERVLEPLDLRFSPMETIVFLSLMAGRSLRVLRLPGFIKLDGTNETCLNPFLSLMRSLMTAVARNCTNLVEMAFQDAGSIGSDNGELLFSNNAALKKLQVDVPCPGLLLSLAESKCEIEELSFLRVQTGYLPELRNLLSERGGYVGKLTIEMCFPISSGFDPSHANRARCRRREKSFIQEVEGLTRTTMTSLRTFLVRPDRRAAWFKDFIKRYQMIGQADLVVWNGSENVLYLAGRSVEGSKPMFQRMSMDLLVKCKTEPAFQDYLDRLHEPDTLTITKKPFLRAYVSDHNEHIESFVKSAIYRKGKGVKNLQIMCPCHRSPVYEAFLTTISEILNRFEEKFESVDQIQALWIPIFVVPNLGRSRRYQKILARLSNLKVIHLVKTASETCIDRSVIAEIPSFLRAVMNACPELESIYISNKDYTKLDPQEKAEIPKRLIENAVIALAEYEEANPKVDVRSLQIQMSLWC